VGTILSIHSVTVIDKTPVKGGAECHLLPYKYSINANALSVCTTEEKENLWSALQITCVFTENTDKTTIIFNELCTVYVLFVYCPQMLMNIVVNFLTCWKNK